MGSRRLGLGGCALLVLVGVASAEDDAFDYVVSGDGTLYSVRCAEARYEAVGPVRVPRDGAEPEAPTFTDLAFSPDGFLYGIGDDGLYLINQEDPSKSKRIGPHGLVRAYGMVALGDRLLVNTAGGDVYTLDRASGQPTRVGPMGGGWRASGDLVVLGEKVLSAVKDAQRREHLVEIDPETGRATLIAAFTDARTGGAIPDGSG